MSNYGVMGLASLAELNYFRLEAMDLFERCLTEGSPACLETFIEEQISKEPPRLELLREVGEDLHQRLLSLREYHYDVLERVWTALKQDFGLALAEPFDHRQMPEADILIQRLQAANPDLSQQEEVLLRKMLDTSLEAASRLQRDVHMTEHLHGYILDWVEGLNATIARRYWVDGRGDKYTGGVH